MRSRLSFGSPMGVGCSKSPDKAGMRCPTASGAGCFPGDSPCDTSCTCQRSEATARVMVSTSTSNNGMMMRTKKRRRLGKISVLALSFTFVSSSRFIFNAESASADVTCRNGANASANSVTAFDRMLGGVYTCDRVQARITKNFGGSAGVPTVVGPQARGSSKATLSGGQDYGKHIRSKGFNQAWTAWRAV